MPSSSSNRSTTIPLSFDRFRVRSIQYLSPFRNHHCDNRIKPSPEGSWIRKVQVHPDEGKSSESERIDHDSKHLFHANKHSNTKTSLSSLSKPPQNKRCANNFFDTHPTSNVTGIFDGCKLPVTNASQPAVLGHLCPPTPFMIDYRYSSLPTLVPTRVVKRPKCLGYSNKESDLD